MKTSLEARVMFVYLCLAESTCIIIPFGVTALLIMDPCTPPFLLSTFRCAEISYTSAEPKIFVVLFEAWMSLQLFFAGSTWVFCILFPGIVAILDYFHFTIRLSIQFIKFD